MPVQHIHLHGGQAVDITLQNIDRDEVAAHVDQRATPCEARLIFDRHNGHGKSSGSDLDELQKSLQSMEYAERSCSVKLRSGIGDGQLVGLVFAQLLHSLASSISVNFERRRSTGLGSKWNSRLPRKLHDEISNAAVDRRVVILCRRDGESLRNRQLPGARLHGCGHGHEGELCLGLRDRKWGEDEKETHQYETTHKDPLNGFSQDNSTY